MTVSSTASSAALRAAVPPEAVVPLTVGQYHEMARAGIPVYWIVNLIDREVEVCTAPSGPAESPVYGDRRVFPSGDEIPVVLDGDEIGRTAVDDLLP